MKRFCLPALLLAAILVLAACGGTAGAGYTGVYDLCMLTVGPVKAGPDDFDAYDNCSMELREDGYLLFRNGGHVEELPYTVEGTAFSAQEGDQVVNGTIENDVITIHMSSQDLVGRGDVEDALLLSFARAGSDAETELREEVIQAGSVADQENALPPEEHSAYLIIVGYTEDHVPLGTRQP